MASVTLGSYTNYHKKTLTDSLIFRVQVTSQLDFFLFM